MSVRAAACLRDIARDRGTSRDGAARDLVTRHVKAQEAVAPEERLTHISTLLRFPPSPSHRGGADSRVRVVIRLDEDLASRAAAVSLRLPGQAIKRGPRDYAPRLLTDAVTTAIARESPYVDEGLEGLPPLLTHREAKGLWRLKVAATLSLAEQRAIFGPGDDRAAVVLREEDVAWHAPWRFDVALQLARQLLRGPDAESNRTMLRELERAHFGGHGGKPMGSRSMRRTSWDRPVAVSLTSTNRTR